MTAVVRPLADVLMQTVITENVTQPYSITISRHVDMIIEIIYYDRLTAWRQYGGDHELQFIENSSVAALEPGLYTTSSIKLQRRRRYDTFSARHSTVLMLGKLWLVTDSDER